MIHAYFEGISEESIYRLEDSIIERYIVEEAKFV